MGDYSKLKDKAKEIRKDIIRMTEKAKSGHPGGSLSAADIVTALYFKVLKHDPKNPSWKERDIFILSKGHCSPALYSAMAEAGYFPKDELLTFRQIDSRLQGHPAKTELPGVEASTGSLGQGLSVAVGYALSFKMDHKSNHVYCMIGDGESEEGQIWEAAMSASHFRLTNLTVILDSNKLQIDGKVCDVKGLEPIMDKWKSFGFDVQEINGHDFEQIVPALQKRSEKPVMIIANTIKGKGVSFMEGKVEWHGSPPNEEQANQAIREIEDG